jgi:hypothetical protein
MEFREDPPDSIIEEIAAILATGYLRVLKAQTLAGSVLPPAIQVTGERGDGTPGHRLHGGKKVTPRKKGE